MVSTMGIPAIRSEWGNWHLLFATQPEPDLEFTEEDLDESTSPPSPPMNAPKRSGKKPLLWILLLLLLGGCLLYTSPSPRDRTRSRMPSSA